MDANGTLTFHYWFTLIVVFCDIENCMVPAGRFFFLYKKRTYKNCTRVEYIFPLNTHQKQASDKDNISLQVRKCCSKIFIATYKEFVTALGNLLLITTYKEAVP